MRNLLVIANRFPHGNDQIRGIFVYSQIKELKDKFDKIVVIALTPYTPKFLANRMESKRKSDAGAKDYSYNNIEVYFLKNIVLPIERFKRKRGWQGYHSAKKILNKINFKPDLIHAHFAWPSGYVAMRLKRDLGVPYIVTGHGFDIYDLPLRNKYYLKTVTSVLSEADYIITVSNINKDFIITKLNITGKDIAVIPNGYDHRIFHSKNMVIVRDQLELPQDKKIVLSVGNLQKVKGHIFLVEAAYKILKENHDILFLIVGDGVERANLEKRIKKYKMRKNFILIGAKPFNEIPEWMNACDLLVIPSLNEAGPAVLFEALACGKPVIGTKVGIIPEILTNKKLGMIVQPKNVTELKQGILYGLTNKWEKNYIKDQIKKYTWKVIANQIMGIYDEVLK
jgi:glycosyltransferase involved in cell wall biosynthesis